MSHYYNDNDAYACQWLRNLSENDCIPAGLVDERSIADVNPEDLGGFRQLHFFAGIGGWPLAFKLAGWPSDQRVLSASCPCQPFSAAGKQLGVDDERHLWPEMFRIIRSIMPPVVVGEQVAKKAGFEWFDGVCSDLEGSGYSCWAYDLSAGGVGAPHIRQRLYWYAIRMDVSVSGRCQVETVSERQSRSSEAASNIRGRSGGVADSNGDELQREPHAGEQSLHEQSGWLGDTDKPSSGRRARTVPGAKEEVSRTWQQDGDRINGPSDAGHRMDSGLPLGHTISNMGQRGGVEPIRGSQGRAANAWSDSVIIWCSDGKQRRVGSRVRTLATGIPRSMGPLFSELERLGVGAKRAKKIIKHTNIRLAAARSNRIGRLRGYGNSIVPPLAVEFIRSIMDHLSTITPSTS